MGKLFTKEQINSILKDDNLVMIGDYKGSNTKTLFKCLVCEYGKDGEWDAFPNNILKRRRCRNCSGKVPYTFDSFSRVLQQLNARLVVIGEYKGQEYLTNFKCLDCGYEYVDTAHSVLQAIKRGERRCSQCSGKVPYTFDSFNEKLISTNRTIKLIGKMNGVNHKTKFECLVCGHGKNGEWTPRPDKILRGRGCPKCAKTGFDPSKSGILYYLKIVNKIGDFYKIGITNKSVVERFLKRELPMIDIIFEKKFENGVDAYNKEQQILKEYSEYRYMGREILRSGNSEIFIIDIFNGIYDIENF